MITLIILVILFAIAIITLIIISNKKFSDKTDYILASISLLSAKLDDIEKLQQNNFTKIILDVDKGIKAEASNITNLLSAIGSANKNIMDSIDVSSKALVNSINSVEEKNDIIVKILEQLTKFNEHHRRMTEMLDNKLIEAKNNRTNISLQLNNISDNTRIIRQNVEGSEGTKVRIQKLTNKVIEVSDEIITNNELLKEVRDKIEAKNSLSNPKTKKSSSKDGKGQNKLKTAKIDDNSHQERIDEIARQQKQVVD